MLWLPWLLHLHLHAVAPAPASPAVYIAYDEQPCTYIRRVWICRATGSDDRSTFGVSMMRFKSSEQQDALHAAPRRALFTADLISSPVLHSSTIIPQPSADCNDRVAHMPQPLLPLPAAAGDWRDDTHATITERSWQQLPPAAAPHAAVAAGVGVSDGTQGDSARTAAWDSHLHSTSEADTPGTADSAGKAADKQEEIKQPGALAAVYDALDCLGSQGWQINSEVLQVCAFDTTFCLVCCLMLATAAKWTRSCGL